MEQKNRSKQLKSSLYWTCALYALTAFHHYYGAMVYNTPWRAHVVFIGGIALLLCLLFSLLYSRYHMQWMANIYILLASILFGVAIGIFEGLYNHVLKNILYFAGLDMNSWRSLFPVSAYEIPDNFIFEASGILQFVAGAAQLYALFRLYRQLKKEDVYAV